MIKLVKNYLNITKHHKFIYAFILVVLWGAGYIAYFRYFGALPQATIALFQEIEAPKASDRIVVFSPHEDDESLALGGYIAQAESNGAQVFIVFATDGNHRNKKETRLKESQSATEILGVPYENLQYYDYPDTELSAHKLELTTSINNTLNNVKPNIVFVSDKMDIHSDHKELGLAIADSVKTMPNINLYTYIIHYKAYPRPQAFRPNDFLLPPVKLLNPSTTWYKFSLNSHDFDKKNEAVLKYKSQLKTPFLHSLMVSFIRQNEIFAKGN
jgi:LmbE family N-acetylglucosaminyl deacetylase